MNLRTRQFKESLIDITNQFEDLPIEVRLTCLQLVTNKVTELANNEIARELELKEEEQCKKPMSE